LPYVVWSLRTQPSRALHGNTPFFMVYGSEAVLPADLKFGAPRLIFENIAEAEATRLEDVDVLEEERLNTVIQSARYQQTLRRYHDKTMRHRSFAVGDLVLRRILTGEGRHKLSPLWEGPFIDGWHRNRELMEHRTPQEVLPLAVFHVLLGRQCTLQTGKHIINKKTSRALKLFIVNLHSYLTQGDHYTLPTEQSA
jgi:hypothetical protein